MIGQSIFQNGARVALLLCVVVLVPACDHTEHEHVHDAEHAAALRLNDGQRWPADESTVEGLHRMQRIIADAAPGPTDLDGYRRLGAELQQEHDTVIRECTMQGPAHDVLHVFLADVSPTIAELQAGDEQAARMAAQRLPGLLSAFDEYFEPEAR